MHFNCQLPMLIANRSSILSYYYLEEEESFTVITSTEGNDEYRKHYAHVLGNDVYNILHIDYTRVTPYFGKDNQIEGCFITTVNSADPGGSLPTFVKK